MAKKPKPPTKPKRPPSVDVEDAALASQPSIRASYLWDPALLRSLRIQTDTGDLYRLGDLCEQIIADDRIGELLESLASDVLGCDLSFEKSQRSTIGDAEKAPELEEDWPLGYDDDELTSLVIWALVTGIGFAKHERYVESADKKRIVPQLKWWHPKHFAYRQVLKSTNPLDRCWYVRDVNGQMTPITAGDGTWVMLTRRGEYRPWANGLWRGLSPWWMLKQYAISDWGVHSEKAAKLVATCGTESTSELRKSLSRYIAEAGKDAVITLPVGFDLKLVELNANTKEIYDAQIEAANQAFAIAILGQNLSSQVEGGSRAAAEVHERKENRKVRYAAKTLSKCLQSQSLSWWAEYNFGDRDLAPFPHWHTEPPDDYAAKATGLKDLAAGLLALKNAGYKLSTDQLEEEYGVELEEVEPPPQPVLAPNQQPTAAPQKPGKQPPKPAKQKPAQAFLASGDSADTAPGFVAGQVYTDALTDKETAHAADYLSGFVDRLSVAIEGAEDYEAVRAAVLKTFADEEDPDRLVDLIENGILLANLAGRHAVDEDAEAVAIAADD